VSSIRPIRELGIWVAIGLVFTWLVAFTLFPALQKVLRTPTQVERKTAAQWFMGVVAWIPRFSYRWRWVTVTSSIALCILGAVALFGLPGVVAPMQLLTNPVDYINKNTDLYKDTRRVEQLMPGLSVADVWLTGKVGTLNQPGVIRGLDAFHRALEAEPLVGSAIGPTSILRMVRLVQSNRPSQVDPRITHSLSLAVRRRCAADPVA
jgi:predicted RND superfamily exporter protein